MPLNEYPSTVDMLILKPMTTTERDAITVLQSGMVIYNSTTGKMNVYESSWKAVTTT